MSAETLLLVAVAAYAFGILSVLTGMLIRHRRSSSQKDYPPKPHPRAVRRGGGWEVGTLFYPDQPTKAPSVPAPRPPSNPTPPCRQVLIGYQPQRTNDQGTDDPGPPPTGDFGVESAAESDPPVGRTPQPDVGVYRWMFAGNEGAYQKALRKAIRNAENTGFPESASQRTVSLEAVLKLAHGRKYRQQEAERVIKETEARGARQREADAARTKPLEDNEVYGMMGHAAKFDRETARLNLNAGSPFDEPLPPPNTSWGMSG